MACRELLFDLLARDYPLNHEVIAYEAATLPITTPRMGKMSLSGIIGAELRPRQGDVCHQLSEPRRPRAVPDDDKDGDGVPDDDEPPYEKELPQGLDD